VAELVAGPVTVSVPATSANLGPGYDALGLALDLRDRVTAEVGGPGATITVVGEGAGTVPLDETHLVHRAMAHAFEQMGCDGPSVRLHCENAIPHGRGLGSSSAAIVAGISLARALVGGGSLLMDDDAVFALAAELEGHPDNVAPACLGGFTIAYAHRGRFRATTAPVDPRISVVVFVPPDPLDTRTARAMLPDTVGFGDAAANAGRSALLVAALGGCPELLIDATEDRLHQGYRAPAMPGSARLVEELRADGLPSVISGAGPTVLVFTTRDERAGVAARVPDGWRAYELEVDHRGAVVEEGPAE
jgi:homoserine kinase